MELYKLTLAGCCIILCIKLVNSPIVSRILDGGYDRQTLLGAFAMLLVTVIAIVKIVVMHHKDGQA